MPGVRVYGAPACRRSGTDGVSRGCGVAGRLSERTGKPALHRTASPVSGDHRFRVRQPALAAPEADAVALATRCPAADSPRRRHPTSRCGCVAGCGLEPGCSRARPRCDGCVSRACARAQARRLARRDGSVLPGCARQHPNRLAGPPRRHCFSTERRSTTAIRWEAASCASTTSVGICPRCSPAPASLSRTCATCVTRRVDCRTGSGCSSHDADDTRASP